MSRTITTSVVGKSNYDEYLICQQRGHVSGRGTSVGSHYYDTCKHCGTDYWTEHIKHENNVPEPPAPGARP